MQLGNILTTQENIICVYYIYWLAQYRRICNKLTYTIQENDGKHYQHKSTNYRPHDSMDEDCSILSFSLSWLYTNCSLKENNMELSFQFQINKRPYKSLNSKPGLASVTTRVLLALNLATHCTYIHGRKSHD